MENWRESWNDWASRLARLLNNFELSLDSSDQAALSQQAREIRAHLMEGVQLLLRFPAR